MSDNFSSNTLQHQLVQGDGYQDGLLPQNQQHHHPNAPQPYQFPAQQAQYDAPPPEQNQDLQQPATGNGDGQQKGNRLRKACDSCSKRKVKCDESGPPCRACVPLQIPCTFDRPSRRRGPPNKHAEAIKKRKLDSPGQPSSPSSPSNVAATLASLSSHAVLSAESICPFSTLELFVDDFFTYIHPLTPFPHEPSFRAAFKNREDLHNPSFLSLLASMVGSLVASFPRNPRLHLQAQHRENLFPNSVSLVERCHKVATEARGSAFLDAVHTVYDAATSYFLGLACAYTFKWSQSRLYFGECLSLIRSLGIHRIVGPTNTAGGPYPVVLQTPGFEGQQDEPVDYIRQEIGRRIFWAFFAGHRSMLQLGASFADLVIAPPTRNDPYPPLPVEVDDQYIFVSHIDPQPADVVSEITGFNLGVKVYQTCTSFMTMELAYGIEEIFDWNSQRRILEESLHAAKKVLDEAPRELLLSDSQPEELSSTRQYYPPVQEYPGMRGPPGNPIIATHKMVEVEEKRYLKYEIQKAHIYLSQLGTRSYFVEKYWNLLDVYNRTGAKPSSGAQSSPRSMQAASDNLLPGIVGASPHLPPGGHDMLELEMSSERELIVNALLNVLSSISQVNMEPNGGSVINKIRQIASTLLDPPHNRKGPLAHRAEEYLTRFLDVLMKLEKVSPEPVVNGEDWGEDDEEALRDWADLRELQTRFAKAGGFLSQL